MRIADCRLRRYELPLVHPLTIGSRRITTRTGLIFTLIDSNGAEAHGEIAPLPGLHTESLDDAEGQLRSILSATADSELNSILPQLPPDLLPSVRCGVEMAIMNLSHPEIDANLEIPICALIMPGCPDIADEVSRISDAGWPAIKIKVARNPLEQDIRMIRNITANLNQKTRLRLDANRGWPLDTAVEFCNATGCESIEYIEEPTRSPADHAAFVGAASIPLALDETIAAAGTSEIANPGTIKALILKPSILGGFAATARWIEFARRSNITPVISCCFQSSITIRSYAIFAAQMKIADTPCGLDTLKFLAEDLLGDPPVITRGHINLSQLMNAGELRTEFLLDIAI